MPGTGIDRGALVLVLVFACSATRIYIRRSSSHDLHAGCFAVAWRLRQVRSRRVVCARLVAVTIAERYLLCADMVYDIAAAI